MVIASPRAKLIVIRILKNLVSIGIPIEVFRSGANFAKEDKDSYANQLFNSITIDKCVDKYFGEYAFLNFFYRLQLHIRSSMWDKKQVRSQGDYLLSQEISHLFMLI
jgi:hypothetical protein